MLKELLGHVLGENAPALDELREVPAAIVVHDDVDVVGVPRKVLQSDQKLSGIRISKCPCMSIDIVLLDSSYTCQGLS